MLAQERVSADLTLLLEAATEFSALRRAKDCSRMPRLKRCPTISARQFPRRCVGEHGLRVLLELSPTGRTARPCPLGNAHCTDSPLKVHPRVIASMNESEVSDTVVRRVTVDVVDVESVRYRTSPSRPDCSVKQLLPAHRVAAPTLEVALARVLAELDSAKNNDLGSLAQLVFLSFSIDPHDTEPSGTSPAP